MSENSLDAAAAMILELRKENAELKERLKLFEWQAIEKAPKNTPLILTSNFLGVYSGISDNNDTLWYDPEKTGWQVPDPTHFLPLPEAPKKEKK